MVSFSNGPAGGEGNNGVRKQDRSGSPFADSQGPTCAACHNTGSFNPSLSIELMKDGQAVDFYAPEEIYTLRYTVTAGNGTPSKYGIQSVVLKNDGNANIGTFGTAPTDTRVADVDTRKYFEHSAASSSNIFEIEWTAPASGSGEITVYAAGATVNGGGTNADDNGVGNTLNLTEMVSAVNTPEQLPIRLAVTPNPMRNTMNLNIQSEVAGQFSMQLSDLSGKHIFSQNIHVQTGENVISNDVSALSAGIYILKITNGEKARVIRVVRTK